MSHVTTSRRSRWLVAQEPHRLLRETWQAARGWLVGDYVLMPDHLHCPGRQLLRSEAAAGIKTKWGSRLWETGEVARVHLQKLCQVPALKLKPGSV